MGKLLVAALLLSSLPGCLAVSAVRAAGDVAEGAVNTTVTTAKTAGKVAGATSDRGDKSEEE